MGRNVQLYKISLVPTSTYKRDYSNFISAKHDMQRIVRQPYVSIREYNEARANLRNRRARLRRKNSLLILTRMDKKLNQEFTKSVPVAYDVRHLNELTILYNQMKALLRLHRNISKINSMENRTFWNTVGGVHLKGGQVTNKCKTVKKERTFLSKKPKTADKHVAVEIEFICAYTKDQVSDAVVEYGLEDYVTVKSDGSVEPDEDNCGCYDPDTCECEKGHELAIIMKEKEYPKIIKRVCRMLKGLSSYVNRTCGLHVHLDMRNRNANKAYQNLYNAQGILMSLVSKSRRYNDYCKPISHGNVYNLPEGRYYAINGQALSEHNTIEVRLHSGTIDDDKICYWISLLIKIVNAKNIPRSAKLTQIERPLRMGKKLKKYLKQRINKFKRIAA